MTSLVSEVTPSVLAAAQHDAAALRRYLRILTEGVAFFAFPAAVGLAVVADDFVLLVLGERWMATTGPLRILALAAALRSITPFLSQILLATNQPKRNMQFGLSAAVVLPILFLVGSNWGMTGVALVWLVGHPLVVIPILLRHALRSVDMPARVYVRILLPAALASAVTAASVLLVRTALPTDWPLAARFAIEVSTGIVTYGVGVLPVYRSRLRAFLSLLRSGRSSQL